MSRTTRGLVVILALAGVGLAATVLHARESAYPLEPVSERLLYLRSGKTADRLMLDFDALAADVYWIRSIQSYGRDLKRPDRTDRFALVAPLLDLTTSLDPHFLIAYRFGAVFLALESPNGPGRPDLSIALLEKGLAANPGKWQFAHDIAFVHYFHTGNFTAAADWFEKGAAMPGAPPWLGPLAATTRAQGGNRAGARRLLFELRESPEPYVRRVAERTLEQLTALDIIDQLDGFIETFKATHGRYPSGWPEMVREHALRGVPLDQYKVPFAYDPVANRAGLSPNSPLSPLPETLKKR